MFVVLGQMRYDLPHAIFAAQKIRQMQPDVVFIEIPEKPFQAIIDKYLSGKINEKKFIAAISREIGKELNIDAKLIDKFESGKISAEELELIEPDASFVHLIIEAKKHKIKVYAVDVPLHEVEKEIIQIMQFDAETEAKAIEDARKVIMGVEPIPFMRWVHEPFNVLEIIFGHHPEKNPFERKAEDKLAKMGVAWERFWHAVAAWVASVLPLNKRIVALRHFDLIREKKISKKMYDIYEKMKKKLKREPHAFALVHVWHEAAVEGELKKRGVRIVEID